MRFYTEPVVTVLARPQFAEPAHLKVNWIGESTDGERLAEFAGRLCYMSQKNPATRSTRDYLENIKKQGHGSVLEHANYSLLLEGVSRSLTHELVRHRAGFAYSQLSQRYVDETDASFVVPPEQLPAYVRGVRKALDDHAMKGVIFGHAGDGHVHVNPLVDVSDADWRATVTAVLEEVTELVVRLGGTLSGEHGDGRLRTPLLDKAWHHETRALFQKVKSAFDPEGILNPGVKVPLAGQQAIADVSYDPALPPLPAAARDALDTIERERDWHTARLSKVGEAR